MPKQFAVEVLEVNHHTYNVTANDENDALSRVNKYIGGFKEEALNVVDTDEIELDHLGPMHTWLVYEKELDVDTEKPESIFSEVQYKTLIRIIRNELISIIEIAKRNIEPLEKLGPVLGLTKELHSTISTIISQIASHPNLEECLELEDYMGMLENSNSDINDQIVNIRNYMINDIDDADELISVKKAMNKILDRVKALLEVK
jgi:hypothetical protein